MAGVTIRAARSALAALVIFGVTLALSGLPLASQAQEQAPAEQAQPADAEPAVKAPPTELEELVVTGSRLIQKELQTSAPVTVFTKADIERTGVTSAGQLLRELPAVAGGAQTTQVNNGGDGTMKVSLRGLGAVRTLVLLNGRRLVQTVSEGGDDTAVDLNTIPTSMIERVEVLKDGASAIYGSDAVAGVVNIITRSFEGFEVSGFYGDSIEGGGERQELSLVTGDVSEKTNWTFYAQYVEEEEIEVSDRHWAEIPWGWGTFDPENQPGGAPFFLGSSAVPWGFYAVPEQGALTLGSEYADDFRPYAGSDAYNYAPSNFQRQPNERWQLGLFGDTKIDTLSELGFLGNVTAFLEASYTNRENTQKLAEVPLAPFAFFAYEGADYSALNEYNPFGVDVTDWRRRMVEGGSRFNEEDEDVVRVLLGLRGEMDSGMLEGLDWEFYYMRGESSRNVNFGDVYNLQRVGNAVGPTHRDDQGVLRCGADPNQLIEDCVPLDVFGQNSVTQEMLDYITYTENQEFKSEVDTYEFTVTKSDLFELPAGPVGLALGWQFREETGEDNPDSQTATLGDAATGTPRQPTSGTYDVKAWYVEASVPLLEGLPLAESLDVDLAMRHSDYSTFGRDTAPKYGVRWRPFGDLMLRGTVGEAFRAPNLGELYGGGGFSFPEVADPCADGRDEPGEVCMDPRVPDEGFTPISMQVRTTLGGRSTLKAESADIYTMGFVWTPSFMEGVSLTFDWYDYSIDDAIATLGADFIMNSCAATGAFCDKIERFGPDPDNPGLEGNIRNIDNRYENVGGIDAEGFDITLGYRGLRVPFGGIMDLKMDASYVSKHDVIQADYTKIEHDGWFRDEQDGHFARWRFTTGFDYHITENFRLSWDTRYIDDVKELVYDWGTGDYFERKMKSATYHDIQAAIGFETLGISHTLMLGCDNLLNRDPPRSFDAFNDMTDVRTFDTVGRFVYARITTSF